MLPEEVSWEDWVVLVEQIVGKRSGYLAVANKWYTYGVLQPRTAQLDLPLHQTQLDQRILDLPIQPI